MTRKQLRASGLRTGGQTPVAQILWKHRTASGCAQQRVAFLYDTGKASPKRQATPAQQAAIGKALEARKICPSCQQVKDYCIPLFRGECNDCTEAEGITGQPNATSRGTCPASGQKPNGSRRHDVAHSARHRVPAVL